MTLINRLFLFLFIVLFPGLHPLHCVAQEYRITVSAGGFDRSETIVSFPFPADIEEGTYIMTAISGESSYVQVDANSNGWFILKELAAGTSRTYTFIARLIDEVTPGVQYTVDENTILFRANDKKVLSYFYRDNNPPDQLDERYKRCGYIHPVYSPSGVVLTSHLNVDRHPHHLGIWSAWTRTKFQGRTPDFWNFHNNTGKVEAGDSLYATWQGPIHAGFRAKHYFVDLSGSAPVTALNEQWGIQVYPAFGDGKYLVFDLTSVQTANTAQPLQLPEYRYGGVGFRGHEDWDNPDNVVFLTSEGLGRDGHATRARWCHIGGYSNGDLAGITVMDHPENVRHPQPMRIHPEMAFFNYAPEQLGDMFIEPGSPYTVRYRFVTYDGEPNPQKLNRLWNDYAYPPGVTVRKIEN